MMSLFVVLLIKCLYIITKGTNWDDVTNELFDGIHNNVYPGFVALVGYYNGTILYKKYGGTYVYSNDIIPPNDNANYNVSIDTHFDMASVTKLMATTTSIFKLYENKTLINSLYNNISQYLGNNFNANGKENIKIINCLLHNAGFYPDPYPYWYNTPQFGCSESSNYYPNITLNCANKIYDDVLNQTLKYQTGTQFIYSDISMMTLSYVIGNIVKKYNIISNDDMLASCLNTTYTNSTIPPIICYYEAYVRMIHTEVFGFENTMFVPDVDVGQYSMPTSNSTTDYRHVILQGKVEDPNAYSNGGIFGHAGLFSVINEVYKWGSNILLSDYNGVPFYDYKNRYDKNNGIYMFNPEYIKLFISGYNYSLSSRGFGFDTNAFGVNDYGGGHVCGDQSAGSFSTVAMHTGYTGTLFCLDRERGLVYILLTNRVYPDPGASESGIYNIRKQFRFVILINEYYELL